jgi:hypothetical protein
LNCLALVLYNLQGQGTGDFSEIFRHVRTQIEKYGATTVVEAQENTEFTDKAVNDVTQVIRDASLECVAATKKKSNLFILTKWGGM